MQTSILGKRELMTVSNHEGTGFAPLVVFGGWRVAMSVAREDETLNMFQRHLETDESFVLLEGTGAMLVAEGETKPEQERWVVMEPMKIYNVRQGIWHAHCMLAGSRLLIVENADTGNANSDDYVPTQAEKTRMLAAMPPLG